MSDEEARVRLGAMLEFAPAFILAISLDRKIDYINRLLPQYRLEDVIGTSWLQYFPPDQHAAMEAALTTVFEGGTPETYENSTPNADGQILWFSSQIAPIRDAGKIVGAVLVSQDITARKRETAELLAGRQMALLGTLSAGVAHEINTPIQFVGDSIEFLRSATNDLLDLVDRLQSLRIAVLEGMPFDQWLAVAAKAEEEADLTYIRQNVPGAFSSCIDGLNRVSTIVRSLRAFAHPSDNETKAVDLNQIIQNTLTLAYGEYKYVADLETQFGEVPPVTCKPGEISQAVLNIVINAAHAVADVTTEGSHRRGLIEVRTRCEEQDVLISIRDTGGGIPEAIRGRIYDPFFTTKAVGKGTGQGLAIARATVEEHAGVLTFETEVGKGTTFFLRLPIAGKAMAA